MDKSMDSLSEKTIKRNATIIKNYGSIEKYQKAARKWGSRGGKAGTVEDKSKAGKLGVVAMREKQKQELLKELREEGVI